MSVSKKGKIISHGKIYLAGNILQRCVSFIMLPIYTRMLSPSDYGTIELLSMVLDFVGIILGLRIGQSIFRFYAAYEEQKDKSEVITTAIYLVCLLNLVGISVLFIAADFITIAVFDDIQQKNNLILFSMTLLMQAFVEIPMTYIRAKQRPGLFVKFSILKLVLQLGLNIIFVVILRMHVEGVIYSAVISSAIMAILLGTYAFKECGINFSFPKARELVFFSLPLMLTGILAFYITFGDRYFLRIYGGLDSVGLYSLAYKFGFLLMFLVAGPFGAIWDSEKYNIVKLDNAQKIFSDTFTTYSTVVLLVCISITLFVKDALHIMSAPPFWEASKIVPVILAAYVTNAWCDYINLGILLKNKTIEITYGTALAGLVITAGYLYLIPKYGALGAAWATLLAFGVRALWVYYKAKRLYDLGIVWRHSWFMVVLWIGVYGLSRMGWELPLLQSILLNFLLICFVFATVLFTPLLPYGVRKQLRQVVTQPKKILVI